VTDGLLGGADGRPRCPWCGDTPDYVEYHDTEWGRPVTTDHRLFEKIVLEGFQSGLSWLTILRKRASFREAFHDFDPASVARFGARDISRLLGNAGIVRHRGKIESAINNAKRAQALIAEEGSLADFLTRFVPHESTRPKTLDWTTARTLTTSPESVALAKELKRRGWSFVGPTTMYAFMQSVGIVNDHLTGCHVRPTVGLWGAPADP
jgi:DNA-3-methyladenine glycosylase I